MMTFRAASGMGADWLTACDACIAELRAQPINANLGFVYVSEPLAHAMDLIAARLKEATGISHWVGTGGTGICTNSKGVLGEGAMVALTASLPANGFDVFDGLLDHHSRPPQSCMGPAPARFGIVHGDPRQMKTPMMIEQLSRDAGAFLVGGLTSTAGSGTMQLADTPTEGGLSGVLMSAEIPVIAGLSQGCTPIGPAREITAIDGPWIDRLDGEPALEVLKRDVGPMLARSPERIAGFILAAKQLDMGNRRDYLVRELGQIDPLRQLVMVGDHLRRGDRLCFVKRDPEGARADLRRLAADLRRQADGRPILGGLYHSCFARSHHMFGDASNELFLIEEEIGTLPLAGLFTNGEIYRNHLYGYSAVLTLFLG